MKHLILILGPTASGKTDIAIQTAQALNTHIISCDSRQFYSQLNIGVARPTQEQLNTVPHHFIACRSITEPYNVFQYQHDAHELLQQLFQTHDTVVAVGGSSLYIHALCNGINNLPDPSPQLRSSLSQQIAEGKLPQLLQLLQQLDPEYYNIVDRRNPIRIQRALEVTLTAKQPYSRLISEPLPKPPFEITKIGLLHHRDELKQRIYKRVDYMMQEGLLEEVRSLIPFRELNTLNTVGYKELFEHLDGTVSLSQATINIKNHTWQYAKKQMNWLKRYKEIIWINPEKGENFLQVFGENSY